MANINIRFSLGFKQFIRYSAHIHQFNVVLTRAVRNPQKKKEKETSVNMTFFAEIKNRKILVFLQKQVDIVSYLT